MFVLENAWRTLIRHPWRTLLLVIIATITVVWSVFGLSVMHEHDAVYESHSNARVPLAVIRPTQQIIPGDNSSITQQYLSWDDYNTYALAAQAKNIQFTYSVAQSIPVRSSKQLQPITSAQTHNTNQNATGGDFTLQSLYSAQAQEVNEYGNYRIVEGTNLPYEANVAQNPVLISQELAQRNHVKVADTITVGNPTDEKTTYTFTIVGIYEYVNNPNHMTGADAGFAKNNRNNVLYTTYTAFAQNKLDADNTKGWATPDLSVIFALANEHDYDAFKKAVEQAGLDHQYTVTSPSVEQYHRSVELKEKARTTLHLVWIVGGLLILALVILGTIGRRNDIGNALMMGVSKPRMAWQFMLEVLLPLIFSLILGIIIGVCVHNPLATALPNGTSISVHGATIGHLIWVGLAISVLYAIIAMIRVLFFRQIQLFTSPFASPQDDAFNSPLRPQSTTQE